MGVGRGGEVAGERVADELEYVYAGVNVEGAKGRRVERHELIPLDPQKPYVARRIVGRQKAYAVVAVAAATDLADLDSVVLQQFDGKRVYDTCRMTSGAVGMKAAFANQRQIEDRLRQNASGRVAGTEK